MVVISLRYLSHNHEKGAALDGSSTCSACMDAICLYETSDPGLLAALLPKFRRLSVAGEDTICVVPDSLG
jgi:hypothetical protein